MIANHTINNGSEISFHDILAARITSKSNIPPIEPIIYIGESIFATKGDISFVTGLPKAGKSAISVFMIATALMKDKPDTLDSLQIYSTYCNSNPVIYIDTEQPPAYTEKLRKTIVSILNINDGPDWLHIYNIRKYDRYKKLEFVKKLVHEYPGTHLWIIDGVADLLYDPNDQRESFKLIDDFTSFATKLNTTFVLYLHENPGSQKMRGNLGSEAERKCGGTITVKKDRTKGFHSIEPRLIRGSADFPEIFFKYDSIQGRMVSLDKNELDQLKNDKQEGEKDKLIKVASQCFVGPEHLSYKQLIACIQLYHPYHSGKPISERTAASKRQKMLDLKIIEQDAESKYCLAKINKV